MSRMETICLLTVILLFVEMLLVVSLRDCSLGHHRITRCHHLLSKVNESGGGVVAIDETTGKRKFMHMTTEQDELLKIEGEAEAALMAYNSGLLKPRTAKKRSNTGGFGNQQPTKHAKKGKGKKSAKSSVALNDDNGDADDDGILQIYAQALQTDGVIRIDNVLREDLADDLKAYLVDLRARGIIAVENGEVSSEERFADVLLNQNRCDLKIPLGPDSVNKALYHILCQSTIGPLIEHIFSSYGGPGELAELYELNCFMSNPGARRQLVHADNVCVDRGVLPEDEPVMLTAFVSLQDTDALMGPTTWLLGTNNRPSHEGFYGNGKEEILRSSKKAVGCLPKGSCALFDPRTLHCAGANSSPNLESTRALFYISFKNPSVDYPGCPTCSGYGITDAGFTLSDLKTELKRQIETGEVSTRLDFAARFP